MTDRQRVPARHAPVSHRTVTGRCGLGADDMLVTSAGLWIASDNSGGSQACGGVNGLAGLCLLPYPAQ